MEINQIRQDFHVLSRQINGKPLIYFDNACQSLRPDSVIEKVVDYYRQYSACGGRSMHKLAEAVTQKTEEARGKLARFIGAQRAEEIIFTRNTTEGINLIAYSLGLTEGDTVLTSDKEHNSNLIPWQELARKNKIIHKIIPSSPDGSFDLSTLGQLVDSSVKLVSLGYTSNLDGTTISAEEIIKIAHKSGALVLLDAAQTVPHRPLNVSKLDVDFLAFSGHKMLGPSGTGVLYGKYQLLEKLEPFIVGGETVERSTYQSHIFLPPPAKFEAGLQDYAGIIGLGAAVDYLNQIGFDSIYQNDRKLNKLITEALGQIPGLQIIGPKDPSQRGSIISFYYPGIDPHQIALMADESANIMVRSGQHCVHSWFASRNITGSVRASTYFYNTEEEATVFAEEIKKIIQALRP